MRRLNSTASVMESPGGIGNGWDKEIVAGSIGYGFVLGRACRGTLCYKLGRLMSGQEGGKHCGGCRLSE